MVKSAGVGGFINDAEIVRQNPQPVGTRLAQGLLLHEAQSEA